MNKKGILQLIEENPIILGINKESDLKLAAKAESQVVFTLFGSISNIGDTIHNLKKMKQLVFVNIDMVDGFSPRNSVVDFLKTMELDGIISSKPTILRYAKEQGIFTIHRFFIFFYSIPFIIYDDNPFSRFMCKARNMFVLITNSTFSINDN